MVRARMVFAVELLVDGDLPVAHDVLVQLLDDLDAVEAILAKAA